MQTASKPSMGQWQVLGPEVQSALPSPHSHPNPNSWAKEGPGEQEGGRRRHLQFTLQSTVQSQWQRQKQWKVHSLLTIRPGPWAQSGRRAPRILATYLSFLSCLAPAVGNRSSGARQMGFTLQSLMWLPS